jgi:hypothetical protein
MARRTINVRDSVEELARRARGGRRVFLGDGRAADRDECEARGAAVRPATSDRGRRPDEPDRLAERYLPELVAAR